MRALITGIEGFAGSHLAAHLLGCGDEVSGTVLPGASTENLAGIRDRLRLVEVDVRDAVSLAGFFAEAEPEVVYHLAGVTFLPDADDDPAKCWEVNFTGTLNVIEAARATTTAEPPGHQEHQTAVSRRSGAPGASWCLGGYFVPPRLVFASSMKVYAPKAVGVAQPPPAVRTGEGAPAAPAPARAPVPHAAYVETDPVGPDSVYGASKAAAEYAALAACRSQGLPVVVLRLFNHIGPRQSESFAAASFAAQVAGIERGEPGAGGEAEPVLRVGNLDAERDFTDVRDVARAYRLAAVQGKPGEIYNIASGRAAKVGDIVEGLGKLARKKFRVETENRRVRAEPPAAVTGDFSKFRRATDWEPEIPLERTLADILEHHRAKLAR